MSDRRRTDRQGTTPTEGPGERRKLLSGLAGALGVLALTGCVAESAEIEEDLGEATSAASGTNVGWVDTVWGANADGDLALRDPSGLGGAVVVIARGARRPGDGGGGLFYWDATSTAPDDTGMILAPQGGPGRWIRVRPEGRINVRWFGAQGNGQDDDSKPIQRAIDACCRSMVEGSSDLGGPGGEVHLPAGTYRVTNPLVLPRNRLFSFTLSGDGPRATFVESELQGDGAAMFVQVIPGTPSWRLTVRDMFLRRVFGGPVFEHASANDQSERIEHLVLENLIFQNMVRDPEDQNRMVAGPGTTVRLVAAINSRIVDVEVYGGQTLLSLESSARCSVVSFSTGLDDVQVNGIRIVGGGQHVLSGVRIESCKGGDALALQGCHEIDVTNFTIEGKATARVVAITAGAGDVVLRSCVIGTGRISPYSVGDGIFIDGTVKNVRVEGGYMNDCTMGGGRALRVMGGATNIRVVGWSHSGAAAQAAANVALAADALDCRVEIFAAYGDRIELASGVVGPGSSEGQTLAMGPHEVLRLEGPAMTIQDVVQGSMGNQHSTATARAGRRVTLIFAVAGYTVAGDGAIVLAGCQAYAPPAGAVLSLIHDGARWIEVSRAEPPASC